MKEYIKRHKVSTAALGLLAVSILGVAASGPTSVPVQKPASVESTILPNVQPQEAVPVVTPKETGIKTSAPQQEPQLSNDNTYTNVDGLTVHGPAYTKDNSVPAGASAQCGDGTYSFSQHRSGTCSHHGGVAEWL